MVFLVMSALMLNPDAPPAGDAGPFVEALWLVQRYGTAAAVDPANDQKVKAALAKSIGKDGKLSPSKLEGFMTPETFHKLGASGGGLGAEEIKKLVHSSEPESRKRLLPKVRQHADFLTTSLDQIGEPHRLASRELVEWIVAYYRPKEALDVVVVCTGNSRRSILGAAAGNIAAAYYGMPEIRFHSGGTAPTACNSRTVNALKSIGIDIEPTGKEAERGEPKTANPMYRVRWGGGAESGGTPPMEAMEFSKRYDDPANPQKGFAALMVCSEADASCPFVKGASLRVSMPYLDPKIYDGGSYESAKYAERRDDMMRLMLAVMLQVRQRIAHAVPEKTPQG